MEDKNEVRGLEHKVRGLEGQLSAYQTFVVQVMKLNLSDSQIDTLVKFHSEATLPPLDTSFLAGVAEGDQNILKIIEENRNHYR